MIRKSLTQGRGKLWWGNSWCVWFWSCSLGYWWDIHGGCPVGNYCLEPQIIRILPTDISLCRRMRLTSTEVDHCWLFGSVSLTGVFLLVCTVCRWCWCWCWCVYLNWLFLFETPEFFIAVGQRGFSTTAIHQSWVAPALLGRGVRAPFGHRS